MSTPEIETINGVQICQTQYNHPDITSGMHTNGPPSIWVRVPGSKWMPTYEKQMHIVRQWCESRGPEYMALLEGRQ